ncbi:permease for cytosine/purines, uracil, thiamine, allantoin-domain-containing protein [Phyllosticta citricarpa]|uniref:Permease for cytosine/purines, uracil, thiamine, allantoin-domain-containing protein n=1 Tax=Phyllosticta citricarpa TaxID=55181 RepID=A0ABR1MRK7_9PEZI
MATVLRRRVDPAKENLKRKKKVSGWALPKESTSFADPDKWSNKDMDVTPIERRTWTSLTILGFWISDAMNAQGWEAPSSIIATGLTYREAIYCIIFGSMIDTIPLVLNGVIGAHLHVPFPIIAKSSFGFVFARFAVVTRMTTALFWHAIQTYTGSTAMTQCIRAIWPSYLTAIPNTIPESVGITSQQLLSHFIFWTVQLPFLLTPPHKLKWFFVFKAVVVFVVSVAVVIAMCKKAGSTGDLWDQPYKVHGSERSWAILSSVMSIAGGWATMATNVPDFTRYMKKGHERGVYWQALCLPVISVLLGLFGIISTSASKVVYGEYLWDPTALANEWQGPAGRCGAFFVGFSWVVGQIGTNLSANVISFANDASSLCPKYINIRRGVLIATITAGWIMVPWKIVHSAQSLLNFMTGLAIFLAPISAITACDYWVVKHKHIDVPSLYRRRGLYRYWNGLNWRAAVAFLVAVVPNTPGLAKAVNPSATISAGIEHIYDMNYLWGFCSAFFLYWAFSHFFPAEKTLLKACIYDDVVTVDGVEYTNDGVTDPKAEKAPEILDSRKQPYAEAGDV